MKGLPVLIMITPDDVLDWLEEQKIIHDILYTNNDGYIRLLKWLEENNAATPENCRVSNCWMLVEAAHKGDIWVLEWLRKHGAATIDDCRAQMCEAFYDALFNVRLPVVEWLHTQGAVTPDDYKSRDFPCSFVKFKGISMLGWLEKQGVNLSQVPLEYAVDIPAFEWLKARGANRYTGCLSAAAKRGSLHMLKWLKDHGLEDLSSDGYCALRHAAENGHTHVLEWLEEQGVATLENCREWACCILVNAAEKGDMSVLNWLDKVGAATPADCCVSNSAPLWHAIQKGHVEVAEWLLARGATMPDVWNKVGLISRVAYNNHLDMLKWLTKKCDVANYCSRDHWGVLYAAAYNGNIEMLNWLNVIKPITRDDYLKQMPWQYASAKGHIPVMQWLYEHGFLRQEDESSMYSALVNEKTDVAEWLYNHGMMTLKLKENKSIIDVANGSLPVLKWLHRHQMLVPADFDKCASLRLRLREMKSPAYDHLEILDWLTKERLFSPDSRAGLELFSSSITYNRRKILRWFAERVDLYWFEVNGIPKIWWDVWYKKQLSLILAGKRHKLRLPAELWELLNSYC